MKANQWWMVPVVAFMSAAGAAAQNIWINEIHYDNAGPDANEIVEVVLENPGNYNLADFSVILYNGNNGASYDTRTLDAFTQGGVVGSFGIFWFDYDAAGGSIQNGSPDGMAVAYQGTLVPGQFLSYEGTFQATDGPASGMMSVDIGVSESSSTPAGSSLQLSGYGTVYPDFAWQNPAPATPGTANNGQTFGGGVLPEPGSYPADFKAQANLFTLTLSWTDAAGGQLPKKYLVKASNANDIISPVDGIPEPDEPDLSDGTGARNVPLGIQTCSFTSLESGTTFYFKIFPYTNSGSDINYKTDSVPPS
ncbi:MAG TPA: hypothetical protein VMC08_09550, partial [Bacteroidales bacterium]|nr:hypothetical protein [Bacteroidales bacterium]